ncbi:MAG: OmpH family outer membrane protein [Aquificaceae bacterium]|nr:OmpH family outer membrane protein [Aquificaceae bacterium]MCS7307517.1 OmpH family outer membrane protein [Aquificaceae bacterium]MDW8095511.1 OmpH family outer membrane protein [Aquificaceae bacterium]MDW8433621.1 OmpH family outer membrane protein [Aquificaceae bacterium]
MKNTFLALLVAMSVSFAQQKLSCIDAGVILSESRFVKGKENELRAKAEEYQKRLDQINKRLEELKKQIESRAISQTTREQRIKEYQKLEAEGMELQQRANRELSETRSKMEEEIINTVRSIAEDIAKRQGYVGVLDCAAFIYKIPELDITREVLQRLDGQK